MPIKTAETTNTIPLTLVRVRARVNRFLFSQVGSQFAAGEPTLDAAKEQWRVPIILTSPGLIVGEVGEAVVSQNTHDLLSHTEIEKIYQATRRLKKRYHAEIEAAFLRTRKV